MKSPCFFVEIFAEKRREVCLMRGQDTVSVLKGVGEQREKRLHRLGIVTVEDLLTHYPREYKDRSEILKIADLPPDEPATFLAQIKEEGQNSRHGRLVYTRMKVYDETGAVGVLWYNQPYMKSSLKIGEWYLFSGRLQKKYGRTEVVSPECERIGENFAGGRILPVYPSVEGLSQKMLRNLMEEALKEMSGGMQEELPLWLRKEYHLAERNFAIENIHFPKTEQGFHDARKRLVFEELFLLLTGSLTAKEKRERLAQVADGTAQMVIGTHAVIQKGVEFQKLGLAITDEQHRFGVRQRSTLAEKGENVHTLVMTATPIPRTLALILYGDLDISIIDELPPGRQKIDTSAVDSRYHPRIYAFIEKHVAAGRQAYVICPMIEENEKLEVQSVLEYTAELTEELPHCRVACVHGKMKAKEKQTIMDSFAAGEIDVLVSTTVVEVGINVPNATIMLIENAERFGLAQLHQLRGRVGRGAEKSYCILVSDTKTRVAKERMKTMTESEDGFVISEKDLKLRGPGEFFGIRQHGLPELKIADLCRDLPILKEAQAAAAELLRKDRNLEQTEHQPLKARIAGYLDGKRLEM